FSRDWSSDVCSSDLFRTPSPQLGAAQVSDSHTPLAQSNGAPHLANGSPRVRCRRGGPCSPRRLATRPRTARADDSSRTPSGATQYRQQRKPVVGKEKLVGPVVKEKRQVRPSSTLL